MDRRSFFATEHDQFRDAVRKFLAREFDPHIDRWEAQGCFDRSFWKAAGSAGLLCPTVPEEYDGPGLDFRYNAVVNEEFAYRSGAMIGAVLQSDVLADYIVALGTEAQKQRYLPSMVAGDLIAAVAMTEPGAGSDLQGVRTTAVREGEDYVINGSKTYISNGQIADLVIVVAKTSPDNGARGISLILVETDRPGFVRGRNLDKIGNWSSDTSELFFENVRVPATNVLGTPDKGFAHLMVQLPQERLALAITAQAAAQRAFDIGLAYAKDRQAFGQAIFDFQHSRFAFADFAVKLQVGWAHIDWALQRHVEGNLTTAEASAAKYWHTEMQWQIVDAALQMHGGAGYMSEYPISRLWRDARVYRILGGTSEIMREIVARSL